LTLVASTRGGVPFLQSLILRPNVFQFIDPIARNHF
jgi:hypothetical protein